MGHLCGYINIPEEHPLYNKTYENMIFNVHGGITFSGKMPNTYKNNWKVGFNCAHSSDLIPHYNIQGTYKTIKYVKTECKKLAKQIWNYHG